MQKSIFSKVNPNVKKVIIAVIIIAVLALCVYCIYSILLFFGIPIGAMNAEEADMYVSENKEQLEQLTKYISGMHKNENITIRTNTPDKYQTGIYENHIEDTDVAACITKFNDFSTITIHDDYITMADWSSLDSSSGILYAFDEAPDEEFAELTELSGNNWYYYKHISD